MSDLPEATPEDVDEAIAQLEDRESDDDPLDQ